MTRTALRAVDGVRWEVQAAWARVAHSTPPRGADALCGKPPRRATNTLVILTGGEGINSGRRISAQQSRGDTKVQRNRKLQVVPLSSLLV